MQKNLTLSLILCFLFAHMVSAQPGKLISQGFYYFDTESGLVSSGDSFTVAYNAQLLPNEYRNFKLDLNTGIWGEKFRSIDYQYDANGNLLRFTQQDGNDIDGWVNTWRYSYTYNANNQELTSKQEQWNGASWAVYNVSVNTYDANGLLLSSEGNSSRQQYTYTAENLLESVISQYKLGGNWVNNSKEEYVYLPNSSLVSTLSHSSWGGGAWAVTHRNAYQYDANGNNTEDLTDYFVQNQWVPGSLLAMEYDTENNLVYWIISNWEGADWKGSLRQFNTFDQNNNFTSARFEVLDSTGWQMASFGRLHYGALSGIHQAEMTSFEVFPNPATSSITLLGENLESAQIIDRQGRVISQVSLNQHEATNVPVSQLAPGLYFIQVRDQRGDSGVKPLMIQR
ncbi:MAG TPA: T9SS type A sorting domain-containing protein [Saprospiraceae bacterium]|nr:T9SS type A sorting domain-containing protein [Saprospiraceae bacterium]